MCTVQNLIKDDVDKGTMTPHREDLRRWFLSQECALFKYDQILGVARAS